MEYKICLKAFIAHTLKYDHNFFIIFLIQNAGVSAQQKSFF